MPILETYFLPHGMQIIPGLEDIYSKKFSTIHEAMLLVQEDVKKNCPDIFILFTPHGLAADESFLIYRNQILRGYYPRLVSSNVDGTEIKEVLEIESDITMIDKLFSHLKEKKINISNISLGAPQFPGPLAWGELVPMYYLHKSCPKTKLIVISLPKKRYEASSFKQELLNIGHHIGDFCSSSLESFTLIFSGDLAHTHKEDSSFGYSKYAQEFDNLIIKWIQSLDETILLSDAYDIVDKAKVCGLSTLTIFQGVNEFLSEKTNKPYFSSHLYSYAAPTYFGMAIAKFVSRKYKKS
jgi:aromatic ring-opening dioxygenase LigB subunit